MAIRFDRMELAGSLGDLGALLPLALGMIVINGLDPVGVFLCVGLFYLLGGAYYRAPIAVQPMKTVGAYAVATGVSATVIAASGIWLGALLLLATYGPVLNFLKRFIPVPVIRGVQVSTGSLLAMQGLKLILGESGLQKTVSEPQLGLDTLLGVPWSIILGVIALAAILTLLDSKRYPAAIMVVGGGFITGLLIKGAAFSIGFHGPNLLPFGLPSWADFAFALPMLVLPQFPMTIGNAVFANADLSHQLFPEEKERVTPKALCTTMGIACIASSLFGGMPMCHGSGGLAAHYRFGARTNGSNIIAGGLFITASVLLGPSLVDALHLLPLAVLGVLLLMAGLELCLTIRDLTERSGLFIVFFMLILSITVNLAVAFLVGILLCRFVEHRRIGI
ncbi:SulP family inorganic anion transporter [Desulfovibrio mangrovi]|uniref:putative sulfate/molybdate transporter n=1 Tax=Desulfovibrio mangrovi TaxID=2976983 RepID=UPI002245CC98|nr:putative sulfate/molybdate transporter [Desulfovibrio mangrovi]UZP68843.1 SulP family inorganic anion transporter [Desulfovibrio mangrovi]